MASVFKNAVQQEIQDQPTWLRYKGTILIVASGLVAILSQVAASPDLEDTVVPMVLTTLATVATALINRFTKDGVTPSAAAKLEQAGLRAHLDRPSASGVAVTSEAAPVEAMETADLPIYAGETSPEYTGQHRAGE